MRTDSSLIVLMPSVIQVRRPLRSCGELNSSPEDYNL